MVVKIKSKDKQLVYVGIDNGLSGGIVGVDRNKNKDQRNREF